MLRLAVIVLIATVVCGSLTDKCMDCICQVEGCGGVLGRCVWKMNAIGCGPYRISESYWGACGSPGKDWKSCTGDMSCSEKCVKSYMSRYGEFCTRGKTPTCRDYAMIHQGGPTACRSNHNLVYWSQVKTCCGDGGCD